MVVCAVVPSDPSQSDPDTRDFWFNMPALNVYLQREAELNPQASYYNVAVLKYQVRPPNQSGGRGPISYHKSVQTATGYF